jgi:hypothetical protein
VAAWRQAAETVLDAAHQFTARQAGQARQQAVEPELGAVLADKVEHQAALLARCQAQAAADLLLEQHRALRGPQQQQRVDHRQVDAFVVEVDRHQRTQLAAEQHAAGPGGGPRGSSPHHAGGRQAGTVEPVGHELGMSHRHAEHEGAAEMHRTPDGAIHSPPAGAHIVAGDQVVDRFALARPVPRHRREVGGVVAGVVLERRQQLQVQRMPQAQLDGRAAVGPASKYGVIGCPSLRSGVAVRPSSTRGANGLDEGVEAVGGQPVALVHNDGVPVLGTDGWPPGRGWSRCRWWRRGGPSAVVRGRRSAGRRTRGRAAPRDRCAAPGARISSRCATNSRRGRPLRCGSVAIVECRHHRLAGAGGGHHQVAVRP